MMKKVLLLVLATAITMAAGSANADSIKGKAGATARIGFVSPHDSDLDDKRIKPDIGVIGGGGLIYGVTDTIAAEFDITRSDAASDFPRSGGAGHLGVTNISLGGQYRFSVTPTQMVPYIGAGLDILMSDYRHFDVDTTVGVHLSGGVDYFLNRQLALTAELKGVVAPEADIRDSQSKQGNFDPSSIATTVGVRFFFY
jgi:outer membrane protein